VSLCYRDRSRSRSRSPSPGSRRYDRYRERSRDRDKRRRTRASTPKIEYITEFGGGGGGEHAIAGAGVAPPSSPPSQLDSMNRSEHWTFKTCNDHSLALAPLFVVLQLRLLRLAPQGRHLGGVGVGWAQGAQPCQKSHVAPLQHSS
jgi:hypothetical protein